MERKISEITDSNILDITKKLQEVELYEKKSTKEMLDKVYEEFESGENFTNEIVVPVFMSAIDALLYKTSLRKKGLTSKRVMAECTNFNYNGNSGSYVENSFDYELRRRAIFPDGEDVPKNDSIYERDKINNQTKLDNYKKTRSQETAGKNGTDEYTGQKNITFSRDDKDQRRNDPTNRMQVQTDHITPLKKVHEQYGDNIALKDSDRREMGNMEINYAVTSAAINQRKGGDTNEEYLKKHGHLHSEEEKDIMLNKQKVSEEGIKKSAAEKAMNNIMTDGGVQKEILGQGFSNAAEYAKHSAMGDVIMLIMKPVYFEITDIFKTGLEAGIGATYAFEAIALRFERVSNYVFKELPRLIEDSILGFFRSFALSLLDIITEIFKSIFGNIIRVAKEGVKILCQSAKIMLSKDPSITKAQKADAVMKIVVSCSSAILGEAIEVGLKQLGLAPVIAGGLSVFLTGVLIAVTMYVLDKIDLFSVKIEKRHARIEEVFGLRMQEIDEACEAYDSVILAKLQEQRNQFEQVMGDIFTSLNLDDIYAVNDGIFKVADQLGVHLPYSNEDEFLDFFEGSDILYLD